MLFPSMQSNTVFFYIRIFAIVIFVYTIFQAIRSAFYGPYLGLDVNKIPLPLAKHANAIPAVFAMRRRNLQYNLVGEDPVTMELENYIFQLQKWEFPSPELTINNRTKRYAKLTNNNDIKLIPNIITGEKISCIPLINNNSRMVQVAKRYMIAYPKIYNDNLIATQNCQSFVTMRSYITSPMTKSERDFPLAYSLVVYKDADMVERILRTIYRPQNFYCLHVDIKAKPEFLGEMQALSRCFPNVFLSSRRVDVRWGAVTIMLADMVCMRDLLAYKWKYFINLTGQEFPLKNNFELVQVLRSLRGANDLESTFQHRNEERYQTVWDINGHDTGIKLGPVPLNITVVKGNMHSSVSRGFVEFLLNDPKSKIFYDWVRDTGMPEETYFATINSNPHLGAPGSFTGPTLESSSRNRPFISREIKWYKDCGGKLVRNVCVNGVADLRRLVASSKLFVNKFHKDFEYLALDCFEEWFFNRTREVYSGKLGFDVKRYQDMPTVTYALRTPAIPSKR